MLLLSLVCSSYLVAGVPFMTWANINGRFWLGYSQAEKEAYLIGSGEAIVAVCSDTSTTKTEVAERIQLHTPRELTVNEIRRALDRFFEAPENVLIPVLDAIRIVAMKERGRPQAEIDAELSTLRLLAMHAPERTSTSVH